MKNYTGREDDDACYSNAVMGSGLVQVRFREMPRRIPMLERGRLLLGDFADADFY
jgi:hypothetical protein